MNVRIHTVGASGSGTTTLAENLAKALACPHFDTDSYYWEKTEPPFTTKRRIEKRLELMNEDLSRHKSWTLSGSLVSWGEPVIHHFTHVIFLFIPEALRIERLKQRESRRYGKRIEPGGDMYQLHLEFMDWAQKYDNGGLQIRSRAQHENWLKRFTCPIIRIEEPMDLGEQVQLVLKRLNR